LSVLGQTGARCLPETSGGAPLPDPERAVPAKGVEVRANQPGGTRSVGADSWEVPLPGGDWLRWQLVDSAFPTGGFAHSAGLEAAWQHGEVRNGVEFCAWMEASLIQVARGSIPWMNVAHNEPERLEELDRHCDVFLTNHVANRASRLQGRAFCAAAVRVFNLQNPAPPLGHLAPVFGCVTASLKLPLLDAIRLFAFLHVRSVIAAAVRLNIVGPMEGQRLQQRLSQPAEAMVQRSAGWNLADLGQTAPLLDLWQGTQDQLYSRLFQS